MKRRTTTKPSLLARLKDLGPAATAISAIIAVAGSAVAVAFYLKPEWRPWAEQSVTVDEKVLQENVALREYFQKYLIIDPDSVTEDSVEPMARSAGGSSKGPGVSPRARARFGNSQAARSFSAHEMGSVGRIFKRVIYLKGRPREKYYLNWKVIDDRTLTAIYDSHADFSAESNREFSREIKVTPGTDQIEAAMWVPLKQKDGTDLVGDFTLVGEISLAKGAPLRSFETKFKLP